jgi:hypothetical protein
MPTAIGLLFLTASAALLIPTLAAAQSLAGVVRDTSGAVLPGVTVEATSAALIERARSTATDGTGQYRITDLPPGAYSLIYRLPGFAAVVREGVDLTGGGVTTIVGAFEESVKKYPLIPMGTPDPYRPGGGAR